MKLKREILDPSPIDISEFKLWARIDNDLEDSILKELLNTAINFFEIKTNRTLLRSKFTLTLNNQTAYFDKCDEIEVKSGKIEANFDNGITHFSGKGEVSFICGYDEIPPIIILWIKNFALNQYENRINDYKNDAVISFYRIKEF